MTYPLSEKVPTLRSELVDNAGRICVCRAGVRNCVMGNSAVADVLATCPNATATVLCEGPMTGSSSLGLLK